MRSAWLLVFQLAIVTTMAEAQEQPTESVISVTLPNGQTGPVAGQLFSCDAIDCTEPETFRRTTLENGRVVREEIPSDPITIPTRSHLKSSEGVEFVLWVEVPGYWSPRILVIAANAVFDLPLQHTGTLTGHLREPPSDLSPLVLEITPPPPGEARTVVPIECPLEQDQSFHCVLPVGRFDITVKHHDEGLLTLTGVTVTVGETLHLGTL